MIVPSYNRPWMLAECLKSVLDQTDADWECIVSDDGSTEDTQGVLPDDPRFRFIAGEHSAHTSVVLNRGIHAARGQYVTVVADDDMLTPNSLRWRLDTLADADEMAFACGAAFIVGERMTYEYAASMVNYRAMPRQFSSIKHPDEPWLSVQGCSVLVSRWVMQRYGIYDEHPDMYFGQDRELWARWCMQGVVPVHCGQAVTFWRQHAGQKTRTKTLEERDRKNEYRARILDERAEGITAGNTPMLQARS